MKVLKKIPFNHDQKDYEIKVLYDDSNIRIVSFLNNRPANGFRYQIIIPKNADMEKLLKVENFSEFIDLSKKDITEKRWQKFSILFDN